MENKNREIYLVIGEAVYEGNTTIETYAFDTYEKAIAEFKHMVEEDKKHDHLLDHDDVVIEEDEAEFSIYQDGYYSEDHYSIYIRKVAVK